MYRTRDLQYFFFGFLTCFVLGAVIWKIVFLQHLSTEGRTRSEEENIQTTYPHDKDGNPMSLEFQAAMSMGALPEDITAAQQVRPKRVGMFHYAFVGGNHRNSEDTKFLGVLRLDDEKRQWKKFIELKGNYSVHDIWHQSGATELENPQLYLTIASSAYGGDVSFQDIKQTAIGKNEWVVTRCYYGATDLGNQTEYIRDAHGMWYAYTWETKEDMTSGAATRIPAPQCDDIPEITIYT